MRVLDDVALRDFRDRLAGFDGRRVLRQQLAEGVRDVLEVLLPEQGQHVVGGIGLQGAGLVQNAEKFAQLKLADRRSPCG